MRQANRDANEILPFVAGPSLGGAELAAYVNMAGAISFWPFSLADYSSALALDWIGGHHLTGAAGHIPPFARGNLVPYTTFDGSSQYWYHADDADFDITGNMALMGWFYAAAATQQALVSKVNTGEISYQISTTGGDAFQGVVTGDGSTLRTVTATVDYVENTWSFVALRYIAATELALFWLSAATEEWNIVRNTTSVPSSLHSGSAQFRIGANQSGPAYLSGGASRVLLCATDPVDEAIINLGNMSLPIFRNAFKNL